MHELSVDATGLPLGPPRGCANDVDGDGFRPKPMTNHNYPANTKVELCSSWVTLGVCPRAGSCCSAHGLCELPREVREWHALKEYIRPLALEMSDPAPPIAADNKRSTDVVNLKISQKKAGKGFRQSRFDTDASGQVGLGGEQAVSAWDDGSWGASFPRPCDAFGYSGGALQNEWTGSETDMQFMLNDWESLASSLSQFSLPHEGGSLYDKTFRSDYQGPAVFPHDGFLPAPPDNARLLFQQSMLSQAEDAYSQSHLRLVPAVQGSSEPPLPESVDEAALLTELGQVLAASQNQGTAKAGSLPGSSQLSLVLGTLANSLCEVKQAADAPKGNNFLTAEDTSNSIDGGPDVFWPPLSVNEERNAFGGDDLDNLVGPLSSLLAHLEEAPGHSGGSPIINSGAAFAGDSNADDTDDTINAKGSYGSAGKWLSNGFQDVSLRSQFQ